MSAVDDRSGMSAAGQGDNDPAAEGEARFVARARDVLLEGVDSLDGRTRSRLTQARQAAIAQLDSGSSRPAILPGRWLAPAGGLAAAVLVAALWLSGTAWVETSPQSAGSTVAVAGSPLDDIAIMADAESLELLEEIEFYAWLDAESSLAPAAGGGIG